MTVMHQRRTRRLVLLFAALVGSLGLTACLPTPVSGVVTEAGTGTPLSGISVQAYSASSEILVAEVITDKDGAYRFDPALPDGTYRLRFDRWSWHGGADWTTAHDVSISADEPVTVDHTIAAPTGSISGTLTLLPFVSDAGTWSVTVRNVRGNWSKTFSSPWGEWSDLPWDYTATGLPAGDYTVRAEFSYGFIPGIRPWAYAPDASVPSEAEVITVGPGQSLTDVDIAISSLTKELRAYVTIPVHFGPNIVVLSEDGDLVTRLNAGLNYHNVLGVPLIPVRLLVYSQNESFAPFIVGSTEENPMGTLFPADTTSVTVGPHI